MKEKSKGGINGSFPASYYECHFDRSVSSKPVLVSHCFRVIDLSLGVPSETSVENIEDIIGKYLGLSWRLNIKLENGTNKR